MSDQHDRQAILESFAALDTSTLRRVATLLTGERDDPADSGKGYLDYLQAVAESDVSGLKNSEKSYGNSWKLRGGVDTFHMLARKWDRLEERVRTHVDAGEAAPGASQFDIFEHMAADRRADGIIDDVRDLRRYLMLVEAEMVARGAIPTPSGADPPPRRAPDNCADSGRGYLEYLPFVAQADVKEIENKERSHGSSWKRRGGISAFMRFARKWDRINNRVATHIDASEATPGAMRENVFEHIIADRRAEGVIDDIRGLRQYLMLVEAEMAARGEVEIGTARDNRDKG